MTETINSWNIPTESLIENTSKEWDFCPKVLEKESFLSWFTRISKENCSDARFLYHQLIKHSTIQKVNLDKIGEDLNRLLIDKKTQNEVILALQPYLNIPLHNFENPPYIMKNTNDFLDYLNIPLKFPRYCPYCLAEDKTPYFRDWWFFKPHMVCPTHQFILLNSCPHCNSPIKFWNTSWNQSILCCSECGKDISEDVNGIFELKDINYYDKLHNTFQEYCKVVENVDRAQFLKRLWEYIMSAYMYSRQELNKICFSSEQLLRIILRSAKEIVKTPTKKECQKESDIVAMRLKIITPLLQEYNRTKGDVKKRAKKFGISPKTLYRWIKRFKDEGITGLESKHYNSGRKKTHFPSDFEDLILRTVQDNLFNGEVISTKRLYKKMQVVAQNASIPTDVFTYSRFCTMIRQEKKKHAYFL